MKKPSSPYLAASTLPVAACWLATVLANKDGSEPMGSMESAILSSETGVSQLRDLNLLHTAVANQKGTTCGSWSVG